MAMRVASDPLAGSADMLQALARCAAQRTDAANPFAGQQPTPRETATNPYKRL